jgi:hypothetical protein
MRKHKFADVSSEDGKTSRFACVVAHQGRVDAASLLLFMRGKERGLGTNLPIFPGA